MLGIPFAKFADERNAVAVAQLAIDHNQWKHKRVHGIARFINRTYRADLETGSRKEKFQSAPLQFVIFDEQQLQRVVYLTSHRLGIGRFFVCAHWID